MKYAADGRSVPTVWVLIGQSGTPLAAGEDLGAVMASVSVAGGRGAAAEPLSWVWAASGTAVVARRDDKVLFTAYRLVLE